MSAGILNFDGKQMTPCEQGADFLVVFRWEDSEKTQVDTSNYTMKMQVRKNYQQALIVELSTTNGKIYYDSNGDVVLHLTAEETEALAPGRYIYDLEVTDVDGRVDRLLKGDFVVDPEVTF